MSAAATWPASFAPAPSSRQSSSAPTAVISAAPPRMPFVVDDIGTNSSAATSTAAKIARPPSSGVASRASPRSLTASTAPTRRASRATSGVSSAATASATRKPSSASSFMAPERIAGRGGEPGHPSHAG